MLITSKLSAHAFVGTYRTPAPSYCDLVLVETVEDYNTPRSMGGV